MLRKEHRDEEHAQTERKGKEKEMFWVLDIKVSSMTLFPRSVVASLDCQGTRFAVVSWLRFSSSKH
jgi:hypothetical protein